MIEGKQIEKEQIEKAVVIVSLITEKHHLVEKVLLGPSLEKPLNSSISSKVLRKSGIPSVE